MGRKKRNNNSLDEIAEGGGGEVPQQHPQHFQDNSYNKTTDTNDAKRIKMDTVPVQNRNSSSNNGGGNEGNSKAGNKNSGVPKEVYLVKRYRPDKHYASMDAFVRYTKAHRMLDASYVRWNTGATTTDKPYIFATRVGGTELGWGRGKTKEAAMDAACRATFALVNAHGYKNFVVDDDCMLEAPPPETIPPPPPPLPPLPPPLPPGVLGNPPLPPTPLPLLPGMIQQPPHLPPLPMNGLPPPPHPMYGGMQQPGVYPPLGGAPPPLPLNGLPPPPPYSQAGNVAYGTDPNLQMIPQPKLPEATSLPVTASFISPINGTDQSAALVTPIISINLSSAASAYPTSTEHSASTITPTNQQQQENQQLLNSKGSIRLVYNEYISPINQEIVSMEERRAYLPRYQNMLHRAALKLAGK